LRLAGEMDEALVRGEPLPAYFWGAWSSKGIPQALYGRHLHGLVLDQVRVQWEQASGAWQSVLRLEEVRGLDVRDLRAEPPSPGRPFHQFNNVMGIDGQPSV